LVIYVRVNIDISVI